MKHHISLARRGYSLIELLVAMAMALVVTSALLRVFWFARSTELDVRDSYLIRQDADIAFRRLQDDLRLTHLASLRVADGDQGISMISPLTNGDLSSFALTPYGTAQWKSWVHYTVNATGDNIGNLVRWELPVPSGTADGIPSTADPSKPTGSAQQSVLTGVLLPGSGVIKPTSPGGSPTLGPATGTGSGGLTLRFVRRENGADVLSPTNPVQASDASQAGWSQGTTGLVQCVLQVGHVSDESGRLNIYQISFRVSPRN